MHIHNHTDPELYGVILISWSDGDKSPDVIIKFSQVLDVENYCPVAYVTASSSSPWLWLGTPKIKSLFAPFIWTDAVKSRGDYTSGLVDVTTKSHNVLKLPRVLDPATLRQQTRCYIREVWGSEKLLRGVAVGQESMSRTKLRFSPTTLIWYPVVVHCTIHQARNRDISRISNRLLFYWKNLYDIMLLIFRIQATWWHIFNQMRQLFILVTFTISL